MKKISFCIYTTDITKLVVILKDLKHLVYLDKYKNNLNGIVYTNDYEYLRKEFESHFNLSKLKIINPVTTDIYEKIISKDKNLQSYYDYTQEEILNFQENKNTDNSMQEYLDYMNSTSINVEDFEFESENDFESGIVENTCNKYQRQDWSTFKKDIAYHTINFFIYKETAYNKIIINKYVNYYISTISNYCLDRLLKDFGY